MATSTTNLSPQYLRARLNTVCVAIQGATPAELLQKAEASAPEHSFLEFRLDSLPNPLAALPKLKNFLEIHPLVTAIATCRRKPNGGGFTGNLAAEVEVLTKAASAGFQLIDLEIESAEALKRAEVDKLKTSGAALIISYHDFEATKDLDAVYARIDKFKPDFAKVVPTAKSLADNLTLLKFLQKHQEAGNVIGIAMGEYGIMSRLLGPRAGSVFTFAAASADDATAPGQIAARALVETYRIDNILSGTKVYGVAGNPVKSSLSPIMQNTAFRRETVNAVYLALQTSKLNDLLKVVQEVPIHGLSITMPLKQEILPHLAKTDPLSAKIGAVNTIVRAQDGNLYGFNTDVGGIVGPIEKRRSIRGAKILVLGSGGAARAAVFGLKDRGADVTIYNRTPETAQKLARQAGAKTIKRDQIAKTSFDVLINATPAGMTGNKLTHILEPNELNVGLVFDLVYNPIETPLLRMAREKNIPIITGVEMFVYQGARQFEIWTGKPAPEEEMLRVVVHALRQNAEINPTPAPGVKSASAAKTEPAPVPLKKAVEPSPAEKAAAPASVKKAVAPAKKIAAPARKAAPAKKAAAKPVAKKTVTKAPAKAAGKTAKKK